MTRRIFGLAVFLALAACARTAAPPRAVPVPPPAVPIPPAPPPGEPADYLNLSADALRAQLGAPQFIRADGTIRFWRYDGASCRAFFFLYGASGAEMVRHVETLPAGSDSAADPACLAAIKGARKTS